VTVTCGVELANADEFELVNVQPVVPVGVPIPNPIATLGDIVVSVTLTVPVCPTAKVNVERLLPGVPIVPVNVSVAVAGVDGESGLLNRLHPPPVTAATIASATANRRACCRARVDVSIRAIVEQQADNG